MAFRFIATELDGVLIVEPDCFRDERGFFLETYRQADYVANGIDCTFVQDNHSQSRQGVLRGLHYQDMSAPMAKLVRCSHGAILDVAVDLRFGSPTFGCWIAVELSDENARQLFVPVGFGHGFLTLSPVAEVQYKCSGYYHQPAEGAVRWDDPEIGIDWPISDPTISERDRQALSLADYIDRPAFLFSADQQR
ncbi:dTDP-4-dehydrorhamnose 3,5-epimerase [Candidatus Viridilinea mediisalina]|uniref:dTDP-4-dehydrorhamnose 3,5-epimerase n=1 Tax=Candidatus Viridilinea mediisalina TaxID=2024553 RepID=A0A2A6RHA0_9CHLR|nr:dTDP-4-dehydrorhamnose 3,5-epimerase [Candidatus Viridilinea mediisalina]PDW02259.1 dTDP-4-dehydrorhamnose 3,5-epimerase [Candidatus Viridilinea mediisalina]